MATTLRPHDEALLRRAIELARQAVAHGNHPFGALLATPDGQILLEAENTCRTGHDATGHAVFVSPHRYLTMQQYREMAAQPDLDPRRLRRARRRPGRGPCRLEGLV